MVEHYKDLIQEYFKEYPLNYANIESFNDFVDNRLQKLVEELGDIIPTIIPHEVESFVIKLKKIWVEKPSIVEADGSKRDVYPSEARIRNLTYSAPIYLEVSAYVDDVQRESFTTVIGKLPIMLKSKYCHLNGLKKDELIKQGEDPDDQGGYFIINGNERVLITVEDLASNKIFVEEKSTGPSEFTVKVFSEMGSYRIPHTIEQMKDGIFYLSFTKFRRIPAIAVVKALGLVKDQDIMKLISPEKAYDSLFINFYDTAELKNEGDALEYLGKKIGITQPREIKIEKVREQLDRYLLPHLGTTENDRLTKAYSICKMVKKYILVREEGKPTPDKDHYMNKRLKLSGDLLEDLFRTNLRNLVQDIMYNFQRLVKRGKFSSIKIIIRDELLTSNIKSALATGSWPGGRKGISQNIQRTNSLDSASHLQRVASLLTSTQENFAARALHPTHWGRLCPIETPEGTSIGLRKNLAIMCSISKGDVAQDKLIKTLESCGVKLVGEK
jgi:DNA-directed RNA polymerase beta subunit